MTTVPLQTRFLRLAPGLSGLCRVVARVLRRGRHRVLGEVQLLDAGGALAGRASTTCALP